MARRKKGAPLTQNMLTRQTLKDDFDWGKLYGFVQWKVTLEQAADFLGTSPNTIERRIKEKYGCSFGEYKAQKEWYVATTLQVELFNRAMNGDTTALIFACKELAGMKEKTGTFNVESGGPLKMQWTPPDFLKQDDIEDESA